MSTTDEDEMRPQLVPYTYISFRVLLAGLTVGVLLIVGLGFAGIGPAHELSALTDEFLNWASELTGLQLR